MPLVTGLALLKMTEDEDEGNEDANSGDVKNKDPERGLRIRHRIALRELFRNRT